MLGLSTNKSMDIVYVLADNSDYEIRYSLRSLINLPHRNVFIVGHKPEWLNDKIIHLDIKDIKGQPIMSVINKIKEVIERGDLSENFILMNDDFFILKTYELKNNYRGTLKEALDRHIEKSVYNKAIKNTLAFLKTEDALDYSLHKPFVFSKHKLRSFMGAITEPVLLRSVYGNLFCKGEKEIDCKIYNATDLFSFKWKDMHSLSTSTHIAKHPLLRNKLKTLFPNKSQYEI